MEGEASIQSGTDDDELAALLEAELAALGQQPDGPPTRGEQVLEPAEPPSNKRRRLGADAGRPSCPPHPGFMAGICIRCGAFKDDESHPAQESNVALRYIHHGLEISASEAERMRRGTASRVLAGRKLLLMLDLDHTLLNSSRFGEVDEQGEAVLRGLMERQPEDAPHIFCLPHMRMWTKLRPGVRQFLQRAHDLFELHIYTMGDREYAAEMARLLDPQGRLFHGRVISSGDTTQRSVKDLDIVLGNENVVLILDDTEGVWPRHRGNLVQIERYTYFPADARRFGLGCQSLLERRMDEDGERGALAVSLKIMAQVHERYFAEDPEGHSDVRRHLSAIRRGILEGALVLFSRIIPLDCAQPQVHPLWRLAEDLGAQCSSEQSASVTHVVATDNTDKTRWAKRLGKHVVNPNWLWCSAFTWSHADESRFPVTGASSAAAQQALQRTVEDDLAAALSAAGGGRGPADAEVKAAAVGPDGAVISAGGVAQQQQQEQHGAGSNGGGGGDSAGATAAASEEGPAPEADKAPAAAAAAVVGACPVRAMDASVVPPASGGCSQWGGDPTEGQSPVGSEVPSEGQQQQRQEPESGAAPLQEPGAEPSPGADRGICRGGSSHAVGPAAQVGGEEGPSSEEAG